eukprot:1302508-Pyramimonas_sp.AAC.1
MVVLRRRWVEQVQAQTGMVTEVMPPLAREGSHRMVDRMIDRMVVSRWCWVEQGYAQMGTEVVLEEEEEEVVVVVVVVMLPLAREGSHHDCRIVDRMVVLRLCWEEQGQTQTAFVVVVLPLATEGSHHRIGSDGRGGGASGGGGGA